MSEWELSVKSLTGRTFNVQVPANPTGLEVKNAIHGKDSSFLPYMQCLMTGSERIKEDSRLSDYSLRNGATLKLIMSPCILHVQGKDNKMYEAAVESSTPDTYSVAELYKVVEKNVGHSMDDYDLYLKGFPVSRTGDKALRDYSIKAGTTLVVAERGVFNMLDLSALQVDVCFLLDCTGSMQGSIDAVKNNIKELHSLLMKKFSDSKPYFGFVRYTDYDQPEYSRTTHLPFTNKPDRFQQFVEKIRASGGADQCEDVMGGLHAVVHKMEWREDADSKMLVHIADAPCHGRQYYHSANDKYPDGDPAKISHETMMDEVANKKIHYWFGYIHKEDTDRMIEVFDQALCKSSLQGLAIRQIDAMKPMVLGEAIQSAVLDSIYSEAFKAATLRKAAAALADDFEIDPDIPDWNTPTITEQTCKKTKPLTVSRLSDVRDDKLTLENPSIDFTYKVAPNPFVEGSKYWVFFASDLVKFRRIILKKFKRSVKKKQTLEDYMKQLEIRAVAMAYAREFNREKLKPSKTCAVDYAPLDVTQDTGGTFFLLEPFFKAPPGPDGDRSTPRPQKMEKFAEIEEDDVTQSPYFDLLQAFSHYTWTKSRKTLLVCNHQGFKERMKERVTLIDPTIHSVECEGKYGDQDVGKDGIEDFFGSHTCSSICEQMKLEQYS